MLLLIVWCFPKIEGTHVLEDTVMFRFAWGLFYSSDHERVHRKKYNLFTLFERFFRRKKYLKNIPFSRIKNGRNLFLSFQSRPSRLKYLNHFTNINSIINYFQLRSLSIRNIFSRFSTSEVTIIHKGRFQ